jgi:poly-gamma-glutamate capsule biosynthesis protein CapA/YwtB (metallophosphatase superfamily)
MGMAWPEARAQLPPNDGKDLLAGVHQLLADAAITFGNLETVLADGGDSSKCGPRSTKCFAFRVPARYGEALKAAGFDLLSTANNHAGDFGPEGRVATMAALDAVGIKHSGVIGDIASLELNGLKVAMIGFSTGAGVYRIQEFDLARKVVAEVDRNHDLVIVSFHGGAEGSNAAHVPKEPEIFYGEDRGEVRKFARVVIDAGADLVLGHGPHLWRGMELYKERLIAYSMGNFSSWETFNITGPLGTTGVLYAELAPNGVIMKIELAPVILEKPGRPVPDRERRIIPIVRQLSKEDFGDALLDAEGRWVRPPPKPRT